MRRLYKDLKSIVGLLNLAERLKLFGLLCLMLVAAFFEAVGIGIVPLYVGFLVDPSSLTRHEYLAAWLPDLPESVTEPLVLTASLILLAVVLLKNGFLSWVYFMQARIVGMQRASLTDRMFRAYQEAPLDWLVQRNTSELHRNILEDPREIIQGHLMPALDIFLASVVSLAVIGILLLTAPGPTLLSLVVIGLGFFTVTRFMRALMMGAGKIARQEFGQVVQSIQQGFGSLVDARIIGCEAYLADRHKQSTFRLARANITRNSLSKAVNPATETFAVLGFLLVTGLSLRLYGSIQLALPALSVLGIAIIRLKQSAAKISGGINQIYASRPYLDGLLTDLFELKQIRASQVGNEPPECPIRCFDRIELEEVVYAYPRASEPALRSVSLTVERGQSVALVGPTGCGKSTLVNCMLGLLEPQGGTIRVNGVDIRHDPAGWRHCLGYIPQSVYLIDDTIRSNIAFGVASEQIDDDRLESVLKMASLDNYVNSLERGLQTEVGERGVRMSGGQRQRLGIARALYFNPQVLVMDEATSALDQNTEAAVMRAIQEESRERTLIVIAHRASTFERCEKCYRMSEGSLQEIVGDLPTDRVSSVHSKSVKKTRIAES